MARRTIRKVAEACLGRMRDLGFKDETLCRYVRDFEDFARYADGRGTKHVGPGIASEYLESLECARESRKRDARRACATLEYFERTGEIAGRGAHADVTPPASSARYLELYIAQCRRNGLAASTIKAKNRDICQFLWHLEGLGAEFPADVDARLVDAWASERAEEAPGYMHSCLSSVRCFLGHLFEVGITDANLGALVPRDGRYPRRPNSKIWTDDELSSLVTSIPTADAAGMRDRAICLLLVTYGMRSSDICALRLPGLDFDACRMSLVSPKTGAPMELPMTDAVWEALAVWLRHGRPAHATCDEVFTTLRAPIKPLSTVRNVLRHRMSEAGVCRDPGGARSGSHSIRHTTATKLVSAGAPLPVVSSTLGQSAANTTMIYVHGSIDDLRRCALGEGVV